MKRDNKRQYQPSPLISKFVKYIPKGRVLDLGCGRGNNSLFLASKGFLVTAVDKNNNQIEKIKRLAKSQNISIKAKHKDIRDFSFRKNYYSAIIATNSLFFLSKKEFDSIIKKMKTAVKENGLIIISSFTTKDEMFKKMSRSKQFIKTSERTFRDKKGNKWYFLKPKELIKHFDKENFEKIFYREEIIEDRGHQGYPEPHKHAIARIVVKRAPLLSPHLISRAFK